MSPPAWWCGLKSYLLIILYAQKGVTTCVVVWIEINKMLTAFMAEPRHHLRGGVD